MKCSPLFASTPLDTWKSEIQLSSGIIIMLFLLSYEVHIMLNKFIDLVRAKLFLAATDAYNTSC